MFFILNIRFLQQLYKKGGHTITITLNIFEKIQYTFYPKKDFIFVSYIKQQIDKYLSFSNFQKGVHFTYKNCIYDY